MTPDDIPSATGAFYMMLPTFPLCFVAIPFFLQCLLPFRLLMAFSDALTLPLGDFPLATTPFHLSAPTELLLFFQPPSYLTVLSTLRQLLASSCGPSVPPVNVRVRFYQLSSVVRPKIVRSATPKDYSK